MLRVALAPVGAGKTEAALNALTDVLQRKRFARVWVLLATRRQQDTFRQRLVELDDRRNLYFNVEFFGFYELYRRLLNLARQPARGLADSARFGLLRMVINQLKAEGALPLYSAIADTPGFLRIVAELIFELKQNQVYPDAFSMAAALTATRKDNELAAIYARYQKILQDYNLVDREGEGWLALEKLKTLSVETLGLDLLVVDGFDQFTIVQAKLLQQLSGFATDTLVTLTTVPGREDTIGRRFRRALEALQQNNFPVETERLMGSHERHPDIQHLGESVFLSKPRLRAASDGLTLIEAPDAAGEVAAVLRRVKRLLVNGVSPDHLLIALRDWTRYQPHFIALAQEYQVPLALHTGEALPENPVIHTLLKVLELHRYDFRRRDLLDVLRSPYIRAPGLDTGQVALLEQVSQRFSVTGGRDLWAEMLLRATRPTSTEDEGEVPPLLNEVTEGELSFALDEFCTGVTPPEVATIEDYVAWLENLIGSDPVDQPDDDVPETDLDEEPPYSLHLITAIRSADEGTRARDLVALQELKHVLRGLLASQELLTWLNRGQSPLTSREQFALEFRTAVENAQVNSQPNRGGRVLVTTAANARGLPHEHVFILGLSEGIFPAPVPEDPLYLDSERRALTSRGILLHTAADRATDDGLFYELISLPRLSLTLTRPTAQEGQPWTESHLWRAVRAVFDPLPVYRLRAGEVVAPQDAASLPELALSVANHLTENSLRELTPEVAGLYNWLLYHQREYWSHLRAAREVEARRLSRQPHDHYSGRLHDPALVAQAAQTVGDSRRWSASQFNEYGTCPFRFFAKRLLRLEELKPPEEGMDVLQTGSLYHELLEKVYGTLRDGGLSIAPEHTKFALDILHEVAARVLPAAPERYGFRPTALWRQEQQTLKDRLMRLIQLDFSPENPIAKHFGGEERYPYQLEAPFGRDGGAEVLIDLHTGDENGSTPGTGVLRVNGYIDRMDRVGDSVIVMDYKSGSTSFKLDDMREGRSFQMVIYLLAAERIIAADPAPDAPHTVAGGFFWHIRGGKISGRLEPAQADHTDVTDSAINHLGRYVTQMRSGDFAVEPGKTQEGRCTKYCEYHHLCRLCGLNLHKS